MSAALLTIDDVAERLQVSPYKARQIVLQLSHVRVGKLLRLRPEVLERYVERGGDGGNAENAADKVAKGRQARGREHAERSANRLTPEQRDEVRRLFAAGHGTMSELGRMFVVTRTAIAKMVARTGPGLASTRPGKRHGQERVS